MSKFKIFLLSITPLLTVLLIGIIVYFNISPIPKIKQICKNLKVIDANKDHNQALDVVEYAKKQGINIPKTIINFDTHSDMYVYKKINPKYGAHIYDWVNEFFAKNPEANEIYWVMPLEEALDKDIQDIFIEKDEQFAFPILGNSQKETSEVNPLVDKTPYIQYFILDTTNSYMTEIVKKEDENKLKNQKNKQYKKVKVITCTQNTLPDFKNKNVLLSIDIDYINNSGYDTANNFKTLKTSSEIDRDINKLLNVIHKKHISPEIITLTLSPEYVPQENQPQMLDFFKTFIKYSGKKDALQEYTRQVDSKRVEEGQPKYKSF